MHTQQERKYSQTECKAWRKYWRELYGSVAIYGALLIPSVRFGATMDPGIFKTVALTCPMIGVVLMIWAIARQVGRMDEYQRGVMLESFAIAAAVTVGITVTYGFLENAGYPRLSMFTVGGVMAGSWAVVSLFRRWMMKR